MTTSPILSSLPKGTCAVCGQIKPVIRIPCPPICPECFVWKLRAKPR